MTPHLEQRLAQIIEENGYGAEIQHAMRLVVSLMELEMAERLHESLASEKWHREIAEGALASMQAELAFRDYVIERYRAALEQIKLYHENMHGAKAKYFIAYDIACKALDELNG